ncbi:MAG: phospholipid carrier-dependent glycosyltransferase, partial [Clostridia bacterium]|nr:phospholipid carrier-dependent glycosyltransferase [Clostridia bacterium]
ILPLSTVDSSSNNSSKNTADLGEPARNTEAYLLMAALYLLLVLGVARRFPRIRNAAFDARKALILGLSAAFLLRILLGALVRGYNTDINCFSAWSERMFSNGPASFYAPDYFCDYPPGYMLLLWPAAAIRSLFGLAYQGAGHLILLKFIPICCDILGAVLICRYAEKKKMNLRIAAALALLYAFNPAAIIDTAAWGQIDSILALLVAVCALQAAEEKYISSLIAFAGAVLIKPQALLFAPLGLFAIIVNLIRRRNAKKVLQFAIGVTSALLMLYITAFVFCIGRAEGFIDAIVRPVKWLIELYGGTMGSYSYITVNALNLYQLLGMNWAKTATRPVWTVIAYLMFAAGYLYSFFLYLMSRDRRRLPLCGGVLIALIFTFGPMIHERYIFPAVLLLMIAYAADRDKRLLASITVMTITAAMNELLVLQGGMTEANFGHLQSSEQWLNGLLSLVNIFNALYLSWVALDICVFKRTVPLRGTSAGDVFSVEMPRKIKKDHRMHICRMDCLLMAVVTVVYACVAFVNLGTTSAPQTSWVSSTAGETVEFDLGDTESFRMIYYGGICNSNFTVELSNDGEVWTAPEYAKYAQGEIFRWIYYVPGNQDNTVVYKDTVPTEDGSAYTTYASSADPYPLQLARYVRITAQSAGLRLSEIGFWGEVGGLLEVKDIHRYGEFAETATDPYLLIDEQDTVAEVPSYLNSTYFDEIYHARTAYEMLHGESVYEWTHPPLGKTLMMLGIEIFGMTPFGWRFMGTLVGVLMLPLMFLMTKQLTKSTKLSFIAMCLMALDSMHFTQTRIATIDSYAVFWIMLMYFFMFRYMQMDWNRVSFARTLVPLGLCGVTMGVAWATKWIGIYGSIGLAAIFFWTLFTNARDFEGSRGACIGRIFGTIGFCIGFFVIIPLLIYYFSYYPQLRYESVASFADMFKPRWVKRVIQLQEGMLSYHAGLGGDTHYFRSDWFEWPVIWWPMWYYSGNSYLPSDMISSISCMGNPAVWWTGLIALVFVLIAAAWRRKSPRNYIAVLIGFASQFLPWVLVPRSTFIYHYFASVPFIILCTALMIGWIYRRSKTAGTWVSCGLLTTALVLFAAFYPLESGLPVARRYAEYLRWFKWYNF